MSDFVDGSLTKQVVALSLEQVPEYKIAEQLSISRHKVKKLLRSDEAKALLEEEGDKAIVKARESFKRKLDALAPLAYEALKKNLEDHKLDAVRIFAEVTGLKHKEEEKQQDATLQVFLPGADPTKAPTIFVPSEVVKDADDKDAKD